MVPNWLQSFSKEASNVANVGFAMIAAPKAMRLALVQNCRWMVVAAAAAAAAATGHCQAYEQA
jgi:hypothetical protein